MINNVVLVGRLTKDADLKYTVNGAAVATFTLAVNRAFTNQSGEREADFVNCVIWRKAAETLSSFTRKGSLIGVVGRIQTRNYDNQQGQRVYVTEVICDNFQMLETRSTNEQRQQVPTSNSMPQDSPYQNSSPISEEPKFFGGSDPSIRQGLPEADLIDLDPHDVPF